MGPLENAPRPQPSLVFEAENPLLSSTVQFDPVGAAISVGLEVFQKCEILRFSAYCAVNSSLYQGLLRHG